MQRKLTLKLEDLSVDSFDTTTTQKAKGTVFGEQCTCYTNCTCPGCPTCYESCNGTCDASCPATCYNTCDDYTCVNCGTNEHLRMGLHLRRLHRAADQLQRNLLLTPPRAGRRSALRPLIASFVRARTR